MQKRKRSEEDENDPNKRSTLFNPPLPPILPLEIIQDFGPFTTITFNNFLNIVNFATTEGTILSSNQVEVDEYYLDKLIHFLLTYTYDTNKYFNLSNFDVLVKVTWITNNSPYSSLNYFTISKTRFNSFDSINDMVDKIMSRFKDIQKGAYAACEIYENQIITGIELIFFNHDHESNTKSGEKEDNFNLYDNDPFFIQ